MQPQVQWDRVKSLFLAAVDLPDAERRAFVERESAGDADTIRQVFDLLAADARAISPLDHQVGEVAHQVLDGSVPLLRQIGRYRIESVLGKGGMGVVYLGVRDDLQSRVAIKVLRDASLSPMRREWFQREERLLAQLNHPSIARLFDADVLPDGTPYFVMEYVEGQPLTEFCDRHCRTLRERLEVLRDVCAAVQHAHRQAMIHRDLKPSNILVAPAAEGGRPAVKLLDFGIARELDDLGAPARVLTASRLMTPAYAAPEQLRGEPIGVYTDVYALGVILYELLTGTRPFDAEAREVDPAAASRTPERPSVRAQRGGTRFPSPGSAFWSDLDVLCLTAMHDDPQRRYATVEALIRDLDHLLNGEPLDARPDALGYRVGKFVRRNRAAVLAASLVATVTIGLVTFYTVRLAAARNAAVAERARTARLQQFTSRLFLGEDGVTLPETSQVGDVIDRGIASAAEGFQQDPALQAKIFGTLGSIARQLGKLPRADSLMRIALDQSRASYGPEHIDVAAALIAMGVLRMDEAKYAEAERLVREGLAMARRTGPEDYLTQTEGMNALGMIHVQAGKYAEAIVELEEAIRLQTARGADSVAINETTNLLANAQYLGGYFDAAEVSNRQVLAWDRRRLGPKHPSVAHSLVNLGNLLYEREKYDEAEKTYREALVIDEEYNGAEHLATARDLLLVSRTLSRRERYDDAQPLADRAYRLFIKTYGPRHPRTAIGLSELGYLATKRRDFVAAESLYARTISIIKESLGEDHAFYSSARGMLAGAYADQGKLDLAEQTFRGTVAGLTKALTADNVITATAQVKLGRVLLRLQRHADAERELMAARKVLIAHEQSAPPSALRDAREGLATVYDATRRGTEAQQMRRELAGGPK
jgi:eukaryotic-like serine/threonine-protein kinase